MINAKRIEEMKRMEEMAVEGPWKVGRPSPNGVSNVGTEYGLMTAQCLKASTAQFIAESRQFVPDIIAAYETQAEEIAKLRKTLVGIYEQSDDLEIVRMINRNHPEVTLEAD